MAQGGIQETVSLGSDGTVPARRPQAAAPSIPSPTSVTIFRICAILLSTFKDSRTSSEDSTLQAHGTLASRAGRKTAPRAGARGLSHVRTPIILTQVFSPVNLHSTKLKPRTTP